MAPSSIKSPGPISEYFSFVFIFGLFPPETLGCLPNPVSSIKKMSLVKTMEASSAQETARISIASSPKPAASLRENISVESENAHHTPSPLLWSRVREECREAFSEFFGTMILVLFGDGVVAQVTLSHYEKGNYQSISWGWG